MRKEECAGALCWQLNDCWPCVSWSLGDYHLRPKLAYFTIKRALAELAVGVSREEIETGRRDAFTRVHIQKETRLQVWAASFRGESSEIILEVRGFDISTGKILWQHKDSNVVVAGNRSTELLGIRSRHRRKRAGMLSSRPPCPTLRVARHLRGMRTGRNP